MIRNVEKTNATAPTITEFDNSVSSTLIATFPQRIVVSSLFESRLRASILAAAVLPAPASASSRSRLRLKKARLSPENIAEWARQTKMPIQIRDSIPNPTQSETEPPFYRRAPGPLSTHSEIPRVGPSSYSGIVASGEPDLSFSSLKLHFWGRKRRLRRVFAFCIM